MRQLNIFFVITGALGMVLPMLAPSKHSQLERRLFWAGFLIAIPSAVLIFYPPDAKAGIGFALLASFLLLSRAYTMTSYIKIRGKIYAFHLDDSRPDPSPDSSSPTGEKPHHDAPPGSYTGLATPGKMWTLLILTMAICTLDVAIYIADRERPLLALAMAALLAALAAGFGYVDASWGYPIARGQHIQFVIISIITAGVFTAVYLGAYFAGKQVRASANAACAPRPRPCRAAPIPKAW